MGYCIAVHNNLAVYSQALCYPPLFVFVFCFCCISKSIFPTSNWYCLITSQIWGGHFSASRCVRFHFYSNWPGFLYTYNVTVIGLLILCRTSLVTLQAYASTHSHTWSDKQIRVSAFLNSTPCRLSSCLNLGSSTRNVIFTPFL